MSDNTRTDEVLSTLDAGLPQALARLQEFLRIPSISTDPAHQAMCAQPPNGCAPS